LLCKKASYGKQKFHRCCGPFIFRLYLSCLQFSKTKYGSYTDSGASTYKHAACVKTLRSRRNDVTTVKHRSSPTSGLPRKIVSPEKALVLPPIFDSDKYVYETLSVQLETLRLSGDLALQQGASRLQTASANLWTFSINITSPLRLHFPLLIPTELQHYHVTCMI
jgi:hypothetical protein